MRPSFCSTAGAYFFAFLYGLVNSVGMFLQYSYADKVPASILFPLSNGGTMVFGLIIGCIAYRKKPTLPDIIQIVIAILGMVLFLI
jgi:glucose uptake protein GlcU